MSEKTIESDVVHDGVRRCCMLELMRRRVLECTNAERI